MSDVIPQSLSDAVNSSASGDVSPSLSTNTGLPSSKEEGVTQANDEDTALEKNEPVVVEIEGSPEQVDVTMPVKIGDEVDTDENTVEVIMTPNRTKPCLKSPRSDKKTDVKLSFNPEVGYAPDVFFRPSYKEQSSIPLEKRVNEELIKRKERLDILREKYAKEADEKLAKEAPFTPTLERDIGKRFETFSQWVENQYHWVKDRAKVQRMKQAMDKANYEAELPEMSKETIELLAKMEQDKRYVSPVAGWKHHFDAFAMKQAGIVTPRRSYRRSITPKMHSFTPVISEYAAKRAHDMRTNCSNVPGSLSLVKEGPAEAVGDIQLDRTTNQFNTEAFRGNESPAARWPVGNNRSSNKINNDDVGSVFDKLYEEHQVRLATQRVMAESYHKTITSNLFQPITNESLWSTMPTSVFSSHQDQPQEGVGFSSVGEVQSPTMALSPSFGFRRHPDEVVDTLLMKGEEYKEKKERLRELMMQNKPKYPFKPKINKKSAEILKDYAMKTRDQLEEELAIRGGRHYDTTPSITGGIIHERDIPAGVKGIPCKKTPKFDVKQFTSRLERAKAVREQNIADLRTSLIEQEAQECTFRPALSHKVAVESSLYLHRDNSGVIKSCWSLSPIKSSAMSSQEATTSQRGISMTGSAVKSLYPVSGSIVSHGRSLKNTATPTASAYPQQQSVTSQNRDDSELGSLRSSVRHKILKCPSPNSILSTSHPQVNPGPKRPIISDASSTASVRHNHEDISDDDDNYLDNLETEMQNVISEWRSTANSFMSIN